MEQYSNLNVHGKITQKADQGTGTDDVVKYPTLTGRVPNALPTATSANAGKAVVVNSNGDGLVFGEAGKVDDVKIGTASLVSNKIATIPAATSSAKGVVQTGTGITNSSGTISVTYGTTAGTACEGNDSRLSNARTPTSHTHGNIANDGSISSNKGTIVITNSSTGKLEASGKSIETNKANITTTATNTIPTSAAIAGAIADAIEAMPEPMIFKGTLGAGGTETSLPTASASNEGFTYKVITAGTYASQTAKIGDTFISTGSAWVLIPSGDEPSGTVTSVATDNVYLQTDQSNSGPITTSGTISHKTSGVTAASYGPSANATPAYNATFNVPYITVDAAGHVTAASTKTVKIPASDNTIGKLIIGASTSAKADATTNNTTTFLNHIENNAVQSHHQIKGSGATTVAFDTTNGLVITSTDQSVDAVGHHYPPTATDADKITVSASGGTASWNTSVISGFTVARDAAGHVTAVTPTSVKIPANPGHYTANLITGPANNSTSNAANTTTNSIFLNLIENNTVRNSHNVVGSGGTTVACDANGKVTITSPALGTGASNAAKGDHTHTASLATSTGTSAITLAHGGKYQLTAGGSSVIFTMPAQYSSPIAATDVTLADM